MLNIPIYRGKKNDSDEYVEGYYVDNVLFNKSLLNGNFILEQNNGDWYRIDPTTLAIYFPFYFIDGLFFSLKNKKGGSVISATFKRDNSLFQGVACCDSNGHVFYDKNDDWVSIHELKNIVILEIED